jgi:hypothetical protein
MNNLEEAFKEIEYKLEKLSPSLYHSIHEFLFLKDNEKIGWSSTLIKEEIKRGVLPHNISLNTANQPFKTFGDAIDNFKGLFVIKQNDKKIKLLKKITRIKKELKLKTIDLNDLKLNKIDKFFTDTKRLENALTLIFRDIIENSSEEKQDVVVEADTVFINNTDMIEIKIIHIGSNSPKTAEALEQTIDKNGGNFKSIYKNLISVCDWSIETVCKDGSRYRIDYLYPEIDNSKPHSTLIENEIWGFTHILRFYI